MFVRPAASFAHHCMFEGVWCSCYYRHACVCNLPAQYAASHGHHEHAHDDAWDFLATDIPPNMQAQQPSLAFASVLGPAVTSSRSRCAPRHAATSKLLLGAALPDKGVHACSPQCPHVSRSHKACQIDWLNEIVARSPSVCPMLRACIASLHTSPLLADRPPLSVPCSRTAGRYGMRHTAPRWQHL